MNKRNPHTVRIAFSFWQPRRWAGGFTPRRLHAGAGLSARSIFIGRVLNPHFFASATDTQIELFHLAPTTLPQRISKSQPSDPALTSPRETRGTGVNRKRAALLRVRHLQGGSNKIVFLAFFGCYIVGKLFSVYLNSQAMTNSN